ncbi:unnamed protein product [Rhizoctonia solani]|uniref:Uncharacterized protein n=1 Tax=Rhizoctonia solani TaxID=456999 RepID=A0A8H3E518_9AGAM|nr:unnamed protein product [Rhizoctonia solani]
MTTPCKRLSDTSKRSPETVPTSITSNPYCVNDAVFANLAYPEQGQDRHPQACWMLGTVIVTDGDYVLVMFSDNQTRWLPVCDVVYARHFQTLEEEPKDTPFDGLGVEIYVSDAVGQAPSQAPDPDPHNDINAEVSSGSDTPRVGSWLGRMWLRKRAASR